MSAKIRLPFVDPAFNRLTAVRFACDAAGLVTVMVEPDDLVHGSLWQNGKILSGRRLPARVLNPVEKDQDFIVSVSAQGLVALAGPTWAGVDCFAPVLLALGSFCPLDETNYEGTVPNNRELYWKMPVGAVKPPETTLTFNLTRAGVLSWQHRTVTHSLTLQRGGELHLIVVLRATDNGRLTVPAFDGQPVTELQV
jgi:hypothetical protein